MSSNSVCNHTRDKQIGLPLRGRPILLIPLSPITITYYILCVDISVINNSNWTEWSTIQGVIGRVISKSTEREADLK